MKEVTSVHRSFVKLCLKIGGARAWMFLVLLFFSLFVVVERF